MIYLLGLTISKTISKDVHGHISCNILAYSNCTDSVMTQYSWNVSLHTN